MAGVKLFHFLALFTKINGQLGYAEIHLGSPTVIKSPDYPRSLGPQVQMEWSISADMGYRIKIVFEDFNLPANHDCKQLFLNIAEGDSTVMNKSDNRICGSHPTLFITKSSKVSIFLRSDSDPKRGAIKNFVLRLEKTRERPTMFKPGQWAGKPKALSPGGGGLYQRKPGPAAPKPAMRPQPMRPRSPPAYGPSRNAPSYPSMQQPSFPAVKQPPATRLQPGFPARAPPSSPGFPPTNPQMPMYGGGVSYNPVPPPVNAVPSYETETSKLEVEENDTSAASYALPIGLLAMVLLVVAALLLVKRYLITGRNDGKEHDVHN